MAVRDEYEVRERVTDTSCKLRVRERGCGSARQVLGTGTGYRHELQVWVWVRVGCRFLVPARFQRVRVRFLEPWCLAKTTLVTR